MARSGFDDVAAIDHTGDGAFVNDAQTARQGCFTVCLWHDGLFFSEIFPHDRKARKRQVVINDVCQEEHDAEGVDAEACPQRPCLRRVGHDEEEEGGNEHIDGDALQRIGNGIVFLPNEIAEEHGGAVAVSYTHLDVTLLNN